MWSPRKAAAMSGVILVTAALAFAQTKTTEHHKTLTPDQLTWGKPPPGVPANIELAVLDGDPTKSGLYIVRLRMPDGARIPPHWHTRDEHVTVISGKFHMGMGDEFKESAAKELSPGGYVMMPGKTHHYAFAKGETIVQLSNEGPFDIFYVNPNDDPRKRRASSAH